MAAKIDSPAESPFPTAQAREAERRRKREAVLIAAVRLFNERGFHAASLDDVAASLGVSKPTIYHYLGNKEQVLIECVTRGLELLRGAAEAGKSMPGTGRDRLVAFLMRYAQVIMEEFGQCVIRTGEEVLSPQGAAQFRQRKREIDREIRTMFEEAIADGSIPPCDVRLAAFVAAGALNWPARWYDPAKGLSPEKMAGALVDLVVGGVAPALRD